MEPPRSLTKAQLEQAIEQGEQLERANLHKAQLKRANLNYAQLERASLYRAKLVGAHLIEAQLGRAHLIRAQLEGADLRDVILGNQYHIGPRLADVQWGTTNLAVVDWSQVAKLGDEWVAEQKTTPDGRQKEKHERLFDYRAAVRANRQLAVALLKDSAKKQHVSLIGLSTFSVLFYDSKRRSGNTFLQASLTSWRAMDTSLDAV